MNAVSANWKAFFDNDCKGEDLWGHYKTANVERLCDAFMGGLIPDQDQDRYHGADAG